MKARAWAYCAMFSPGRGAVLSQGPVLYPPRGWPAEREKEKNRVREREGVEEG